MRTLCFLLLTAPVLAQTTHRVNLDGSADFTDIQSALDAAADGDTVLVAPGEYVITEPINFNRLHDPKKPDSPPVRNIKLRSEAGPKKTTIRVPDTSDREVFSVVAFTSGESERSILEGFLLTGGKKYSKSGGGLYCSNKSSPTVTNCTISGNSANSGGGVFCRDSSPTLKNCTISGNSASFGGGVSFYNSSPTLTNCTISENSAENGGGVNCDSYKSLPKLTNCTISENRGSKYGGGVYCEGTASLSGCTISGNWSGRGGGVHFEDSSAKLTNCVLSGNRAHSGGAVHCEEASPSLTNCTVSGNFSTSGGGLHLKESSPKLVNCIVWDNAGGSVARDSQSVPQFTYSCVEGEEVPPGAGNLNRDPLFVKKGVFEFERSVSVPRGNGHIIIPRFIVSKGDYRLRPGSPAIDAGVSKDAPTTDIQERKRGCGKGVDIGAFEFCAPTEAHGDSATDSESEGK